MGCRRPGRAVRSGGRDGTARRTDADRATRLEAACDGFLSPPGSAPADFPGMNRSLLGLAPCLVVLAACTSGPQSATPGASRVAMGMVGSAQDQDSDSSFKGKPGDMQDSSFVGKPGQGDPNAATPAGTGYNQQPGELQPQMGGGDIHYHNHFYGDTGYAAPVYGAPVQNRNLGPYNVGRIQAPLGTGGGGAGWYGPNYQTGPTGLRQGYGPFRGVANGNGWNGYNGGYNGWTD